MTQGKGKQRDDNRDSYDSSNRRDDAGDGDGVDGSDKARMMAMLHRGLLLNEPVTQTAISSVRIVRIPTTPTEATTATTAQEYQQQDQHQQLSDAAYDRAFVCLPTTARAGPGVVRVRSDFRQNRSRILPKERSGAFWLLRFVLFLSPSLFQKFLFPFDSRQRSPQSRMRPSFRVPSCVSLCRNRGPPKTKRRKGQGRTQQKNASRRWQTV